jgi:hypothetical protein
MGACETTPTTTRDRGKPAQRPLHTPARRRLFLAPRSSAAACRHQARSSWPAPEGARCGRSSLTPDRARHKPAATRKNHNHSHTPSPAAATRSPGNPACALDSGGPHGCVWDARPARARRHRTALADQPRSFRHNQRCTGCHLPRLPLSSSQVPRLGCPPGVASRWLRQPRRGTHSQGFGAYEEDGRGPETWFTDAHCTPDQGPSFAHR